jgi:fatty acid desaturase
MFVHELVHLPENKFRGFRIAWNLLCGLPFLVPSFTYYTHLDHHRRKSFGTDHDGEYLSLASGSPWQILVYLSQCLWVGPLVILRFLVLTPLSWFSPRLRKLVYERASSLVMDPRYLRPQPTARKLWIIRLQEFSCFLICLGVAVVPPLFLNRWPVPFVMQAYAISVVLIFMNCVRTMAAHRYHSAGREQTFVEQILDSVNIDSDSILSVIINPVGLRYHALHHLFPSLPYHNARQAHCRLMAQLPADSPYRRTVKSSVLSAIADLWRRMAAHRRAQRNTRDSAVHKAAATA